MSPRPFSNGRPQWSSRGRKVQPTLCRFALVRRRSPAFCFSCFLRSQSSSLPHLLPERFPHSLWPFVQVTLKSKEISRLPEFVVDTSRETLAGLIHMETACKNVMRRPAVLEVTMADANDLAICSCLSHIHSFLMASAQPSKRFVARFEPFPHLDTRRHSDKD